MGDQLTTVIDSSLARVGVNREAVEPWVLATGHQMEEGLGSAPSVPARELRIGLPPPMPVAAAPGPDVPAQQPTLPPLGMTLPPMGLGISLGPRAPGAAKPALKLTPAQLRKAAIAQHKQLANEHLTVQPTQNIVQNKALSYLRDRRPKTGLNDAGDGWKKLAALNVGYSRQEQENCCSVTLGALFGENSSAVIARMLRKHEAAEADIGLLSMVQDQSVFFRIKNGKLRSDLGDTEKSSDVGQAQMDGIREMLGMLAEERNSGPVAAELAKACGGTAPKYKLVQDGVNDTDPDMGRMYSIPTLLGRMSKYPDGTQFQVFVYGAKIAGHWIYGEKYNGRLVVEDYQKANTNKLSQDSYLDQMPHHPNSGEADAFDAGMFFAIVPAETLDGEIAGIDPPFGNSFTAT